jgi:hypothetical protein
MSPTTGSITGSSSLTENVNIFTASQQVSAAELHITFDPNAKFMFLQSLPELHSLLF